MGSSKQPASNYDETGDFYYNFIKDKLAEPVSFFHQNIAVMLRLLGDIDTLQVCDLACGEGFLSRLLAAKGARVTGVDLSHNLLRHAQQQSEGLAIVYIHDDAQMLSKVADATFDAVVCHMALMDIPELEAVLLSVHRVLKQGGAFIFCILHPCFESPFDAHNPPHEVDDRGNAIAIRVTKYGAEGKWYSGSTGMRGTLGSIHRTLSTYLNSLIGAGFTITELDEPMLEPREGNTFDEQLRTIAPRVLIVKAARQRHT